MTPAASWPGVIRRIVDGNSPSITWTSDRQMPDALTRTSTSSGPGSGIGTVSSESCFVKVSTIAARIVLTAWNELEEADLRRAVPELSPPAPAQVMPLEAISPEKEDKAFVEQETGIIIGIEGEGEES